MGLFWHLYLNGEKGRMEKKKQKKARKKADPDFDWASLFT
jgi:hypothetical protein